MITISVNWDKITAWLIDLAIKNRWIVKVQRAILYIQPKKLKCVRQPRSAAGSVLSDDYSALKHYTEP